MYFTWNDLDSRFFVLIVDTLINIHVIYTKKGTVLVKLL